MYVDWTRIRFINIAYYHIICYSLVNERVGSDVVEWLLTHVEGFNERKDARKYASTMLKSGFIRHTVNKLTFSEQCYYVFGGELVNSMMQGMQIRDGDNKSLSSSDVLGPLPPPSSSSPHWSNPYSSSAVHQQPPLAPMYAPMPYSMTGGYESNAYSYPQEPCGNSGSGKSTFFPTITL